MKIFLINLKKDTERLNRILQQFEKFNITNFEIVEAVYGKKLNQLQLNSCYDSKVASRIVRELSLSEIGCALSHIEVYHRIIKENKRCLVIEDDIILSDEFTNFIDIEIEDSCDVVFFGLDTSNCEHENLPKTYPYKNIRYSKNVYGYTNRCYLKESYSTFGGINFYDIDEQSVKFNLFIGTHAYAPSVEACYKIININYPIKMMADYVWNFCDLSFKIPKQNIVNLDRTLESTISFDRNFINQNYQYSKAFIKKITGEWYNK